MGLLDIAGSVLGGGNTQQGGLMNVIMGLVNQHGGLPGLVQKLQQSGLGDQVASWVGTGSNLPVSANQIQAFLGSEQLQQIAGRLGLNSEGAAEKLATVLPQAIDTATPEGRIPEDGLDVGDLLKNLLG